MKKRFMRMGSFLNVTGHHVASWRHPLASPLPLTDVCFYQDVARRAEAGLFDSIFLADQLALGNDVARAGRTWLEPITTLAALAGATSRIGLIATASTTYTEPYNLARQFASLDHISGGRVGWNIVTSWATDAARNYGGEGQLSHAERYARGDRVELSRFDGHRDAARNNSWSTLVFRVLSNDPSRSAALLAGDVDIIEQVPPADLEKFNKNNNL